MAKTWKAGVIGCGSIAQHLHLPGYLKAPGVEPVAACDPARARHGEVKNIVKDLNVYTDYKKMLAKEQFDVVSVASPNKFHAEHAIAATGLHAGGRGAPRAAGATCAARAARTAGTSATGRVTGRRGPVGGRSGGSAGG